MPAVDEPPDIDSACSVDDLGEPPSDRRARAAWVRQRFVQIGCVWYADASDSRARSRASELEDLAVALLTEHHDVLPSLSTLQREVANWSFLPSTVAQIWQRAFPLTADQRARATSEWQMLDATGSRVAALRHAGAVTEAEALRSAAVTFFNKYLAGDEVGNVLRAKARKDLRKA